MTFLVTFERFRLQARELDFHIQPPFLHKKRLLLKVCLVRCCCQALLYGGHHSTFKAAISAAWPAEVFGSRVAAFKLRQMRTPARACIVLVKSSNGDPLVR